MCENPVELILTLKKRPHHSNLGQIYMKPFRIPARKKSAYYINNLPSPRTGNFLNVERFIKFKINLQSFLLFLMSAFQLQRSGILQNPPLTWDLFQRQKLIQKMMKPFFLLLLVRYFKIGKDMYIKKLCIGCRSNNWSYQAV